MKYQLILGVFNKILLSMLMKYSRDTKSQKSSHCPCRE